MEAALSRNQVISVLTKSPHGDLAQYAIPAIRAAKEDPTFFSHLIAWNQRKGAIRDAKVALPVLALTNAAISADAELRDNALAHVAALSPRDMARAVRFAKGQPLVSKRGLVRLVERYLVDLAAVRGKFERVALQHRASLVELHALLHIKPLPLAQEILFDRKKVGVFADVANLSKLSPAEAASIIVSKRIPFLIASGAMGAKMKDPDVLQALMEVMTPTELVTNAKMLEKLGIKTIPALRGTFEAKLVQAAESGRAVLKTTRAAEAVGGSTGEKLKGVQEKQLNKLGVDGDWLVLADKSGSMRASIEAARHVAALLARVAKGKVSLVFYDTMPIYLDVTGKTLEEITALTKRVEANGGTKPGCALQLAADKGLPVDGIAMVSDLNENGFVAPSFAQGFATLSEKLGKVPTLYAYQFAGDPPVLLKTCPAAGIDMQVFDLTGGLDYYSLPNLVQTMRTNRYGLYEEIMDTPLLRLGDVFKLAA